MALAFGSGRFGRLADLGRRRPLTTSLVNPPAPAPGGLLSRVRSRLTGAAPGPAVPNPNINPTLIPETRGGNPNLKLGGAGAPNIAPPLPNIAPKARPTLPGVPPGGHTGGDFGPGGNVFVGQDPGRGTIGPGGFVPNQPGGPTTPGGLRPRDFDLPTAGTAIDRRKDLLSGTQPPVRGGPAGTDDDEFLTPFGPGDDLRFQQINPLATRRLGRLQDLTSGAAESLGGAPSLTDAAQERLRLFEEQSQPGFERNLQDVGRRAAALGRLGAGMTTSELGDVTTQRERALADARRQTASDLAFAEGGERRANLGALGGVEGDVFGRESAQRGELRDERGFQTGTAREALENRVRQRLLEEQLRDAAFGRDATRAQLGLGAAEGLGAQAGESQGAASDLLGQMALLEQLRRRGGRRTGTAVPTTARDVPA